MNKLKIAAVLAAAISCPVSADQFSDAVCNAMASAADRAQCKREAHQQELIVEGERLRYEAAEARRKAEEAKQAQADQNSEFNKTKYGEKCGGDFDCWAAGMPGYFRASWTCDKMIEDGAKYQAKWRSSDHYVKRYNPANLGKSYHSFVIGYGGNELLYQNGFGGWHRMNYICWFDVLQNKPIAIDVTKRE